MAIGIFVLFITAIFLSRSNVKSQSLLDTNWANGNENSPKCATIANFKEEMKKLLNDHLANVKNELTKTKNELKKDFMEIMPKNKTEEKLSKTIQAAKNQWDFTLIMPTWHKSEQNFYSALLGISAFLSVFIWENSSPPSYTISPDRVNARGSYSPNSTWQFFSRDTKQKPNLGDVTGTIVTQKKRYRVSVPGEPKQAAKMIRAILYLRVGADALEFKGNNIYQHARSFGGPVHLLGNRHASSGLSAITSCFWMKTDVNQGAPTMLSYAVPQRDNEFIVQLYPNITVLLKTKIGFSFYPYMSSVWVSDGKWHHVCVTWENVHGTLQIYKDAVLSDTFLRFKPGQPIAPNGIWIVGQEQDFFGGGFQTNNAFKGALTEVNVWNRVLDGKEISTLANECASSLKGNYKAYNDFIVYGGVKKFRPSCCN